VNRRVVCIVAGLLLTSAGIVSCLLSGHAHNMCFDPFGSGTGIVPSARRSGVNCTVANWSYSLGVVAIVSGAIVSALGLVVVVRDRVAPIDVRPS
jgi:hypothetical protein